MLRPLRAAAAVLIAIFAAGCATTPGRTLPDDRWEGFNRRVYKFNDTVDRAALKPVAKGYSKITPRWMRIGIGNFFGNLEYPATMVNQFLQGKPKLGLRDTGRFLLNSTLGIAGLFDVATAVGLEANDEDLGQTLAVWGVGSGPFVNLPFFGPSTVRDAPSRMVDFFFDPFTYVDIPWEAVWGERVLDAGAFASRAAAAGRDAAADVRPLRVHARCVGPAARVRDLRRQSAARDARRLRRRTSRSRRRTTPAAVVRAVGRASARLLHRVLLPFASARRPDQIFDFADPRERFDLRRHVGEVNRLCPLARQAQPLDQQR